MCVASKERLSHREEVPLKGLVLFGVWSRDLDLRTLLAHSENVPRFSDVEAMYMGMVTNSNHGYGNQ